LYQLYEKATYNIRAQLWKYSGLEGTWIQWGVKWIVTMGVVLLSWVFFRAQNLDDALLIINHIGTINMISINSLISAIASTYINALRLIILVFSVILSESIEYKKSYGINKMTIMIWLIIIFGAHGESEFIYFQF